MSLNHNLANDDEVGVVVEKHTVKLIIIRAIVHGVRLTPNERNLPDS